MRKPDKQVSVFLLLTPHHRRHALNYQHKNPSATPSTVQNTKNTIDKYIYIYIIYMYGFLENLVAQLNLNINQTIHSILPLLLLNRYSTATGIYKIASLYLKISPFRDKIFFACWSKTLSFYLYDIIF